MKLTEERLRQIIREELSEARGTKEVFRELENARSSIAKASQKIGGTDHPQDAVEHFYEFRQWVDDKIRNIEKHWRSWL